MLQVISTDNAPKAVGPYSQAIRANGFIFLSGQIPLDPKTGTIITGSIAEQTRQVMNNLSNVLESAGSDLSKVVKTTVFLTDMGNFDEMNAVYGEFFTGNKPARATVQVSKLPKNANIEIEAVALG
jgi:2-iminobutanoate/2-iminopropanoate deaminase